MNTLKISWKNLTDKPLSTTLSLLLFALGVGLISLLMLLDNQLEDKFEKNLAGIDLVVGAPGSPLQMILSSVFHVDNPTGNISLEETRLLDRIPWIEKTIPLALGDSYRGYRIVGTTHEYVQLYDSSMSLQSGRLWEEKLEVTLGATVAQRLGLRVDDTFFGAHGLTEAGFAHDDEHHAFRVTGILQASGTVIDQLILTNVESIWAVHDLDEPPLPAEEENHEAHEHEEEHESVPAEEPEDKEITSLLVFYKNKMTGATKVPPIIEDNTSMKTAAPAMQMARLQGLIGVGEETLKAIALIIVIVSGFSIFIALYSSLRERRYELALMRVMGASRLKLFFLIVQEGLLLALLGYLIGIGLSHGGMEVLASRMEEAYRYSFTGAVFLTGELQLLAVALLIGFFAALIPALQAMNTEISTTLAEG